MSGRVLISDKVSPRAVEVLRESGIEADLRTGLDEDELIAVIGDYDGLIVRSATKVTARLLEAARSLKVIGRAGIGVDNIDLEAATQRGIVVMNTPTGNAVTTAEHAIALMFALARKIPEADRSTQAGKWEKSRFMGVEITNKTLGIAGCGNIGSIVADRARGLRMQVIAYDPFLPPERAAALGVERVDKDELLARSDFLTLHLPLTEATRNFIDREAIARMKPGIRLIDCARGGLVDEAALREALESGHVAGAALDVFSVEPARENVLFGAPNFVATPHLGASTTEAQENVALEVARQVSDYLLTGAVVNAVNTPSISAEEASELRPCMVLAEQLGSFIGQVAETSLQSVTVEYAGQVAGVNTGLLTNVVLQGLLKRWLETVNYVNAPVFARERGIVVKEIRQEECADYQSTITLTVSTERQTRTVVGTLYAGDKPRIVRVQEVPVEAELGPHMLYIRNRDRPGLIGRLGTLLAEAGVNIATFHLGRTEPGGDALALVQVDQPISEETLKRIRALPDMVKARTLHF